MAYSLGITSCLLLGLSDLPHSKIPSLALAQKQWLKKMNNNNKVLVIMTTSVHAECVEIVMNLLQGHDDDWDLMLFVNLTTLLTKWKDILASFPLLQPALAKRGCSRGYQLHHYNDTTVLNDSSTILATLIAFNRCNSQINNPLFWFNILCKLWDSVGLHLPNYTPGVDSNSGSGYSSEGQPVKC
jgi:hypothetical protein